ncbi:hypothetical protein ACFXJJ_21245, partial [Streptomyces sp. NPDC059233]
MPPTPANPWAAPVEPAHVEPAHVEPAHVEPAHVEPAHVLPAPPTHPRPVPPGPAQPWATSAEAVRPQPAPPEPAQPRGTSLGPDDPQSAPADPGRPRTPHVTPAHPRPVHPGPAEPRTEPAGPRSASSEPRAAHPEAVTGPGSVGEYAGAGESGRRAAPAPEGPAAVTVPRQKDGTAPPGVGRRDTARPEQAGPPEPLDHPDPTVAAEAATVENLLRCWVREAGLRRPDGPAGTTLRIPLPASGAAVHVPVRHWSPAGWHRFGPARLAAAPTTAPALDAVTLAALLAREGTRTRTSTGDDHDHDHDHDHDQDHGSADLVA